MFFNWFNKIFFHKDKGYKLIEDLLLENRLFLTTFLCNGWKNCRLLDIEDLWKIFCKDFPGFLDKNSNFWDFLRPSWSKIVEWKFSKTQWSLVRTFWKIFKKKSRFWVESIKNNVGRSLKKSIENYEVREENIFLWIAQWPLKRLLGKCLIFLSWILAIKGFIEKKKNKNPRFLVRMSLKYTLFFIKESVKMYTVLGAEVFESFSINICVLFFLNTIFQQKVLEVFRSFFCSGF